MSLDIELSAQAAEILANVRAGKHHADIREAGTALNGKWDQAFPTWLLEKASAYPVMRAALEEARIGHLSCDDGWYSCPKSTEGCLNPEDGQNCTCGADEHNARIDAALGEGG